MKSIDSTRICLLLVALAVINFGCLSTADAQSFRGVGDLPGDGYSSGAYGVSADGSVVVGYSLSEWGGEAFRWENDVMSGLGDLPGGYFNSIAYDVSGDGSVIVGSSISELGREAFYWTQAGGMVGLGTLPGSPGSFATGVSDDGLVVVGHSYFRAWRWTQAAGMVALGSLPGGFASRPAKTSADGSVVVGWAATDDNISWSMRAFRWTQADGMVDLGTLPGDVVSEAYSVSADGSVVVGWSGSDPTCCADAIRWTEAEGMISLGSLWGEDHYAYATDCSADGSIIVGGDYDNTTDTDAVFIWDEVNGMRNLKDVLISEYGLDLTGWTLMGMGNVHISADGLTIVGRGYNPDGNPEGWIAELPPRDPIDMIVDLIGQVMALNLQQGIENSLDAKLNSALGALDDISTNNDAAAINTLEAFINAVEAQRGDKIPNEADAEALITAAEEIIGILSGG
jgi:probable HAF family extracellular repeat protein